MLFGFVFFSILTNALLPILVIVAVGYALQRWRPLESQTLVTLNLYLFVPAYLFMRVLESELSWLNIAKVGVAVLTPIAILGALGFTVLRRTGVPAKSVAALLVGGLFANAGNFGLPVAELAFGNTGAVVHAVIVLFANFSVFSIAYAMLAIGQGGNARAVLGYFRLPYFYCVVLALVIRDTGLTIPTWLLLAGERIANGLVPIALVTLGAQLAAQARWPNWKLLAPALLLKLVLLPIVSFGIVCLMGLWPWPGIVIVLAAAAPTAINPLLLAMQLDGDSESLSNCVFWTTLLSALSVTVWLALLKGAHPELFLP